MIKKVQKHCKERETRNEPGNPPGQGGVVCYKKMLMMKMMMIIFLESRPVRAENWKALYVESDAQWDRPKFSSRLQQADDDDSYK